MSRKNAKARKRHRGLSSADLAGAIGCVTPRQRNRARRHHALRQEHVNATLKARLIS